MSDSINLNDYLAQFDSAEIFDRFQQRLDTLEEANSDRNNANQASETGRANGRRRFFRNALTRSSRARGAVMVELSQRGREAQRTRETEAAQEQQRTARPPEEPPPTRANLRQTFQQAVETFRAANPPVQPGDGGEATGGAAAFAGLSRAAPRQEGAPRQPGPQAGRQQPVILANREPPRLDGVRMAASFVQTALGTALNQTQPPVARAANVLDRGPAAQGGNLATGPAATFGPGGGGPLGGGANPLRRLDAGNAEADQRGFGGLTQEAQGPLGRIQERLNSPGAIGGGANPLAAGRGGALAGQMTIGGRAEAGPGPQAGIGTDNIRPAGGTLGRIDNLNANNQPGGANATPLTQANTAPGEGLNEPAGLGRNNQMVENRVVPDQLLQNRQGANPAIEPGGAAAAGGGQGLAADRGAAVGPGAAMGQNPPAGNQVDFLQTPPENTLGVEDPNRAGAVPTLNDVQAGVAAEQGPANPVPPTPEPPQTPAEQAAGLGTTVTEAADAEIRANVPRPILQPPEEDGAGRTPAGQAADQELRAGPAAPAGGPAAPAAPAPPGTEEPAGVNPAAGEARGTEEAGAPRAGFPAGEEQAAGPGATRPGAAEEVPPATARMEEGANEGAAATARRAPAGPAERPEEGENQLEARVAAAYEQQQLQTRTNEPNEGRSVIELFVR